MLAIDFSVPAAAIVNISIFLLMCLSFRGTTGWLEQYDEEMVSLCTAKMALSSQFKLLVWASIYSLKSMNI
jgi:hypothetical protein